MDSYKIVRAGFREFAMDGDTTVYTRKLGAEKWEPYESQPQPAAGTPPLLLGVVRHEQQDRDPLHWSLFLAEEGKPGKVYQVTGDSTFMVYAHGNDINELDADGFHDFHQIAELGDESKTGRVEYWANNEPPPRAESQAHAKENCQGWTIRVVRRLIAEGIVHEKWDEALRRLVDSYDIARGLQPSEPQDGK
ncbi:hypothetical protein FQN52_002370 [Onygenales sp. PD_12]|nr:hypothetical protein FQN52_002370 [Onygenales sp. PD_12]